MEIELEIKNGNLDLALSGTIIVQGDQPTIFTILDNGLPLDVIINFEDDDVEPMKSNKRTTPAKDKNAFEIVFINYNSNLGTFNKQPWVIGESNNRNLYFLYTIFGSKKTNLKRIEYSFYLGEEVSNG